MIKPGRVVGRWRSAGAFPGVEADVVVIAAGAEERGMIAHARGQLETQHAGVERQGPVEVRDLQVNVADIYTGIDRFRHPLIIG